MPQIINEKSFASNLGARTGKAAGEALSEGIGGIARARINQLLEKELGREGRSNEKKALTGILGGDEKLAEQFLGVPQENRYKMLDQFFQSGGLRGAQPGQQRQAPISGLQPSQMGQQQPQLGDQLKSALTQPQGQAPVQQHQPIGIPSAQPTQEKQFPVVAPQLPTGSPLSQTQKPGIQAANQAMQRPLSIGEVLSQPRGATTGKGEGIEQKESYKSALKDYKEIKTGGKAAKEGDLRLDRMEALINKGNLSNALYSSGIKALGLKGYGIDLSSLLTGDTQEFDKLSNEFVKDAKPLFGAKLTDLDLRSYMATIPSSTNSDAGKKAMIRNIRTMNAGKKIKDELADQIYKENGNRVPLNFESELQSRFEPYQDQLADIFKAGTAEAVNLSTQVGNRTKSLPNASIYPEGTEVTDRKNNIVYVKQGEDWVKRS